MIIISLFGNLLQDKFGYIKKKIKKKIGYKLYIILAMPYQAYGNFDRDKQNHSFLSWIMVSHGSMTIQNVIIWLASNYINVYGFY